MTISINSSDFIENFDVSTMKVGIVGFGYVGQAIDNFFGNQCFTVTYDKSQDVKGTYDLDTLEEVVGVSHVIFVAVPTPMNKDGSCYTGIVESVLDDIKSTAVAVGRDTNEFIIVLKSTVTPGFTESMKSKGLRVVFSPEFLTEANSFEDLENTTRVLIGGDDNDTLPVIKLFEKKLVSKAVLGTCDSSTTLEMVKLYANTLMAMKVSMANEMFAVCQKLGIDYNEVKSLMCLDQRINISHLSVPGPDGNLGYGGSCFVKDVNNMRHFANQLGTGEKLLSAMIDRNIEFRPSKDWEDLKGRAVVDEDSD